MSTFGSWHPLKAQKGMKKRIHDIEQQNILDFYLKAPLEVYRYQSNTKCKMDCVLLLTLFHCERNIWPCKVKQSRGHKSVRASHCRWIKTGDTSDILSAQECSCWDLSLLIVTVLQIQMHNIHRLNYRMWKQVQSPTNLVTISVWPFLSFIFGTERAKEAV